MALRSRAAREARQGTLSTHLSGRRGGAASRVPTRASAVGASTPGPATRADRAGRRDETAVQLRSRERLPARGHRRRRALVYPTSPLVIRDVVVIGALVADSLRTARRAGRAYRPADGRAPLGRDPVPPDWPERARGRVPERHAERVGAFLRGRRRGLVFVPTGNAAPDSSAAAARSRPLRLSTVALDAETGAVRWHFQSHHDLWDYGDAQPALFQIDGVGGGAAASSGRRRWAISTGSRDGPSPLSRRGALHPAGRCRARGDALAHAALPHASAAAASDLAHPRRRLGVHHRRGLLSRLIGRHRSKDHAALAGGRSSIPARPGAPTGAGWRSSVRGLLFIDRMPMIQQLVQAEFENLDPERWSVRRALPDEGTPYG